MLINIIIKVLIPPHLGMLLSFADGKPLPAKLHNRVHASIAYAISKRKDANAEQDATDYFNENVKGDYGAGGNRKRRMKQWHMRFVLTGSVHDAPRSGCPPCLPDATIFLLAKLLILGYWLCVDGKKVWRGFTSLEAARGVKEAKQINKELDKYPDVKLASVAKRIRSLVPWTQKVKRTVDTKHSTRPETKAQRLSICQDLRRLLLLKGPTLMDAVTFIDAKKMFIAPAKHMQVYNMDYDLVNEDVRLPQGKQHNGKGLHYYAGVNAKLGVVIFVWVTGTTGLPTRTSLHRWVGQTQ